MKVVGSRPIRVLFVLPSLRGGGAERVVSAIASRLPQGEFEPHLALVRAEGVFLEQLSPHVSIHDLKAPRTIRAAWPLIRLLRTCRFDVVVTCPGHVSQLLGLIRWAIPRGTRWVAREASQIKPYEAMGLVAPSRHRFSRHAYRHVDRVICLSRAMQAEVVGELGVRPSQTVIINNPVIKPRPATHAAEFAQWPTESDPRILGVGRLSFEKGFDQLIAAFPHLLRRRPKAGLVILGDGNMRSRLESQVQELGIADRVQMPGFQSAAEWWPSCDLLVVPSRVEGVPNVLLEAVDSEVPVVALQHPGGTGEVMNLLGLSSRVVSDLSCWDEGWFRPPSPRVAERANELFGIDQIVDQYAAVLKDVVGCASIRAA